MSVLDEPGGELSRLLSGTRLDPRESTLFSAVVIIAVVVIGGAGSVASFQGQIAVADWARLGSPIAIVVPVVVDLAIVVFSLAAILLRSRGESTRSAWFVVGFFTGVSISTNALHVLSESLPAEVNSILRPAAGSFVAALMPLSIFLVTHTLIRLLVQKPSRSADAIKTEIAVAFEIESHVRAQQRQVKLEERVLDEAATQEERQQGELFTELADLKDDPMSAKAGTPERERFKELVLWVFDQNGGVASRAAQLTGVSYKRVISIVNEAR